MVKPSSIKCRPTPMQLDGIYDNPEKLEKTFYDVLTLTFPPICHTCCRRNVIVSVSDPRSKIKLDNENLI